MDTFEQQVARLAAQSGPCSENARVLADAVWTAHPERERKLAELQKRYAWFGGRLAVAHEQGMIDSEAVRFFIAQVQPILYDDHGDPILDADGLPVFDWDAEPTYYGRAQAYSYVGQACGPRPERTVAGQVDLSLQMLDRASPSVVLRLVCEDLSAAHAREMYREQLRTSA